MISSRPSATSSLPCSFAPQGLFCPGQMHLYLAFLFHRDYFGRPNASLSGFSASQELFCPGLMHLYLAFLLHRDYFGRPDLSLSGSFAPQGLLCPSLMHLYLALLLHRDYFGRPDSSLSCSFAPQGLFRSPGFISICLFCSTGIISAVQIHLYLAFLFHRDYFGRPDSSLSCSFAPQGLFRPAEFISIWLFCSTGIISTS